MQSLFQEIGGPGKFQTSSKYLKLKTYELNIRHEKHKFVTFAPILAQPILFIVVIKLVPFNRENERLIYFHSE